MRSVEDREVLVDQLVQLTVFSSDTDRRPGSLPDEQINGTQAEIGDTVNVSARLKDAPAVRLRLRCGRPDTVVVLSDALLAP